MSNQKELMRLRSRRAELQGVLSGGQEELTEVLKKLWGLELDDAISRFAALSEGIVWSPEFHQDPFSVYLSAWESESEPGAISRMVREMRLVEGIVRTTGDSGVTVQLFEEGDLRLNFMGFPAVARAIQKFQLTVRDLSSASEKIDRKIGELQELKKVCANLVSVEG
jgi:hypothetical protein